MGDFDRNAKPAEGSQAKKLIMVGVLAAVLLGVVGMQFLKGGPAPADASTGLPAGAATQALAPDGADESPDALRAALSQDPTPALLVAGPRTKTVAPTDHNPFSMGRAWRVSITPKDPTPDPQPQVVQTTPIDTTPGPVAPLPIALKAEDYKLSMILSSNGQWIALINGSTVSAGSRIRDAVVLDVSSDAVVLRHKDFPEGRTLKLSLKPN